MNQIFVEEQVNKMVMPDNLKVGLMVAKQHQLCVSQGCNYDFFGFGFGQSPFHVPQVLENALAANASKGHYSDAQGIIELREAISGFNKRHFDLDVDPERIIVGPGTKDLIHTVISIIQGGVILPSPSWIGYRPQVNLLNKHFHTFHLKSEFNYKIQPDDLDEFVSKIEEKQHILVLNNPHNPTGSVYSQKELEDITKVCRKHNVLVLSDEIYALSTYDIDSFVSMGKIYPEGSFITNGLSKDRSAGGYRLGSLILPTTDSEKLAQDFKKVAATVYTNVSTPTQYAAIAAYEQNSEIEEYFKITRKIHEIMGTYLSEQWSAIPELKVTKPQGGFYFFVDFNSLSNDLKRKGVLNSNQLGDSLISCPYHLATVTGDANMLEPDNFGARIAFVDYNGKEAFDNFKNVIPKNRSEEIEFVKQNAPRMVESTDALKTWINYIKE